MINLLLALGVISMNAYNATPLNGYQYAVNIETENTINLASDNQFVVQSEVHTFFNLSFNDYQTYNFRLYRIEYTIESYVLEELQDTYTYTIDISSELNYDTNCTIHFSFDETDSEYAYFNVWLEDSDTANVGGFSFDITYGNDITYYNNSLEAYSVALGTYYINSYFTSTTGTYQQGYETGLEQGYNTGLSEGYGQGYSDGYNEGSSVDTNMFSIFNGILNVCMLPINFFLSIFNFEILGINITGVVSALLSVCVVIIVIRLVTGKKE